MGSGYSMQGDSADPVERNEDREKIRHTITFWSNGFSVDDGPLRALDDPANAAFLNDINNGRVPAEFAGEQDPYVSLINKGGQPYEPPAASASARAFVGTGHSLGGSTASSASAGATVQAPTETISVDESAPTTTIQMRLHDGTRITQRFNLSHTVGHIYAYVASASPGVEFDLNMSFPRKKLDDKTQTIEAAQLQNAALTQSLK